MEKKKKKRKKCAIARSSRARKNNSLAYIASMQISFLLASPGTLETMSSGESNRKNTSFGDYLVAGCGWERVSLAHTDTGNYMNDFWDR